MVKNNSLSAQITTKICVFNRVDELLLLQLPRMLIERAYCFIRQCGAAQSYQTIIINDQWRFSILMYHGWIDIKLAHNSMVGETLHRTNKEPELKPIELKKKPTPAEFNLYQQECK